MKNTNQKNGNCCQQNTLGRGIHFTARNSLEGVIILNRPIRSSKDHSTIDEQHATTEDQQTIEDKLTTDALQNGQAENQDIRAFVLFGLGILKSHQQLSLFHIMDEKAVEQLK